MAEHSFQEVMAHFKRMCEYYQREHECPMGCIMSGMNRSQCMREAFEKPITTEKTIMRWAAENPEPVYPTFAEWLNSIGVTIGDRPFPVPNISVCVFRAGAKMFEPIPADIAEKLGIEPKEG